MAFLAQPKTWLTNKDVEAVAKVSDRTVRLHTKRMAEIGIIDQAEVFPGHRYRFAAKGAKRDLAYVTRLEKAMEVFGVTPKCN